MIIKRYNEAKKVAEELRQYNVLHVDSSDFSRYAVGSLLMQYEFIVKNFFSVRNPSEIAAALRAEPIDLLLINYALCRYDIGLELRKLKQQDHGLIMVVYNYAQGTFEKIQLLKAGVNAVFDPDYPFEDLLFALQEIRSDAVFENNMVDKPLLKKVRTSIVDSAKEIDKESLSLIRDTCKGMDDRRLATKHKLSPARLENQLSHLRKITGCESRSDFIRFAMMNKVIREDLELLNVS